MSEPSRALDRLMRQPPTPFAESCAYRRVLAEQRRATQARLRTTRRPVVFAAD